MKRTKTEQLKSNIAKARKESIRLEKEQKQVKDYEERLWIELDKLALKKLARKEEKEAKRKELLGRKAQAKLFLELELKEMTNHIETIDKNEIHLNNNQPRPKTKSENISYEKFKLTKNLNSPETTQLNLRIR